MSPGLQDNLSVILKSFQLLWLQLPIGAYVNSLKFHETALHHAARLNKVDMIKLLVEFGANVYASDNLSRKPVDYTTPASPSYTYLRFYESKFLDQFWFKVRKSCCWLVFSVLLFNFANCFYLTGNPLSLQQLCRITVRKTLGTRASKVIDQLNISHRIHSYLQYCNLPTSLYWYMRNGCLSLNIISI